MGLTRRQFLRRSAIVSGGLGLRDPLVTIFQSLGTTGRARTTAAEAMAAGAGSGLGPLVPDPKGLLDLPPGFTYRLFSAGQRNITDDPRWNHRLTDGDLVPGAHDGMGAFPGPHETTILVRNHELTLGEFPAVDPALRRRYDPLAPGGTTTLWVRPDRTLARDFGSLSGLVRPCAGGTTPWATWLVCEEATWTPGGIDPNNADQRPDVARRHGYVFEVPAAADDLVEPRALKDLGRFRHEAAAVDPATGWVYLTEDRFDSLFYRFRPAIIESGVRRPSELREGDLLRGGGVLEALAIKGRPRARTCNRPNKKETTKEDNRIPLRLPLAVEWVPIPDPDPVVDTWRRLDERAEPDPTRREEAAPGSTRAQGASAGAALFDRGEGMTLAGDSIVFIATNGGRATLGQVWRYQLIEETLELIFESGARSELDGPDNITLTPWGDLLICEDGVEVQFLVGMTPEGRLYPLARNAVSAGEFAGACFSADGRTMFVNCFDPGITFAVWGPWPATG